MCTRVSFESAEPLQVGQFSVGVNSWETGTNLHRMLKARNLDAQLVSCTQAQDVGRALSDALAEITNGRVPIVHIESHGDSLKEVPMRQRAFGARSQELS